LINHITVHPNPNSSVLIHVDGRSRRRAIQNDGISGLAINWHVLSRCVEDIVRIKGIIMYVRKCQGRFWKKDKGEKQLAEFIYDIRCCTNQWAFDMLERRFRKRKKY
jgi:hypothetical protein